MRMKSLIRRKKWTILWGGTLLAFIILLIWLVFLLNRSTFYQGISVDGLDVAGMDVENARVILTKELNEKCKERKLTLKSDDNVWYIGFNDISLQYKVDEALKKAYVLGRKGNVFKRIYQISKLRFESQDIPVEPSYDKERLIKILSSMKGQIDQEEKNASVSYKEGKIIVDKEAIGRLVDVDKNLKMIENSIEEKNLNEMNLFIQYKTPKIVYEDVQDVNQVLTTFSTDFNPYDSNRSYNLKLACEKISGTLLMPKEIFSMNKALGPRTVENGYQQAPVILNDELVLDAGGGVCQVTTTLYNAVLRTKLEVLERVNHSMTLGYAKPGQDATIAGDYIDFKFQNNKDYPVFVHAEIKGNAVVVKLIGKKEDPEFTVQIKSVIVEEYWPEGEEIIYDSSTPENERITVRNPKKGVKVVVYRETYDKNGNLIEKETISEDVYRAVKAQVKINPSFAEKEETPEEQSVQQSDPESNVDQ